MEYALAVMDGHWSETVIGHKCIQMKDASNGSEQKTP